MTNPKTPDAVTLDSDFDKGFRAGREAVLHSLVTHFTPLGIKCNAVAATASEFVADLADEVRFALYASPRPSDVQGEAVAWAKHGDDGGWIVSTASGGGYDIPLYLASPAPSVVDREKVEADLHALRRELGDAVYTLSGIVDSARAALDSTFPNIPTTDRTGGTE